MESLTTAATFASAVAGFVVDASPADLPSIDRAAVVRSCLDGVGTALAGRTSPHGRIAEEHVCAETGDGPCSVLGTPHRRQALAAATANGTFAHADDFDDMGGYGHPTVALLPALVAAAELRGGACGEDLVLAYAVGFELGAALCRSGYDQYERCFHSTPVFGTLAAAAATARLLELDRERTASALTLAASFACGLGRNSGTMVKPLHAGLAAANGLLATVLAQSGASGAPDAFERRGGFAETFFGHSRVSFGRIAERLGVPFTVADTLAIKRFPCCGSNQSALNAVEAIIRDAGLVADDVDEVVVHDMAETSPVLRYPRAVDGLQAKFSIHFTIAQLIRAGRLGIDEFSDAETARDDTKALMTRVRPRVVGRWERRGVSKARGNPVTIRTRDGRTLHEFVPRTQMPGTPNAPLPLDEVTAKFRDNARRSLNAEAVDRAAHIWGRLDEVVDVREAIRSVCA